MGITETISALENYTNEIGRQNCTALNIPVRSDGSTYNIEDMADDQKQAMAGVIDHLKRYCEGTLPRDRITMRLTVSGAAGSGKSTWINTLVSVVRQVFNNNDVIGVYGPTGSAAFNAGGETMNRGFRIPIKVLSLAIDGAKHKHLLSKFASTVAIIIDERSMIEAEKLGCVKHYMDKCAHGGETDMDWGGIPIVVLVGDDYQLPPIGYGAFYAIQRPTVKDNTPAALADCREKGFDEFLRFAENTVYLGSVKRVNAEQDQLRRILEGLRCEESDDELSDDDMERLLQLNINHRKYTKTERKELQDTSMYLFANKEPRDALNEKMLQKANRQGNPVAKMKSKTIDRHGRQVANNSHYDTDRNPTEILLCKTAKVALNGQNICPSIGLYHGSIGTVEDIVYHDGQSPSCGDLPAYVLVNFAQYCGRQLVPHSKMSVPITPMTSRCKLQCCSRTSIPLTLAYGKTVHTFQGQTVGPVAPGRPENAIKRIIVEPGNRQFEGNNVGLFYTTVSRATTIGNPNDNKSSAIYFDGPDFSKARVTNLTREKSGNMYKKAMLRKKWVTYMKQRNHQKQPYTTEQIQHLIDWITTKSVSDDDLKKIIQNCKR
jgi:hypothetical protein